MRSACPRSSPCGRLSRTGGSSSASPDDSTVEGEWQLGDRIQTSFSGRPVLGRIVEGPWAEALSELAGKAVRVARTEREGDGYDRGQSAGASIVSTASLEALGRASGATEPVDGRRFRMTIGIDTEEPHVEDTWIGSRVRVGGAVVLVRDNVGRCAVTTRDPGHRRARPRHARRDRGLPCRGADAASRCRSASGARSSRRVASPSAIRVETLQ